MMNKLRRLPPRTPLRRRRIRWANRAKTLTKLGNKNYLPDLRPSL